jgi:hypothetical protein
MATTKISAYNTFYTKAVAASPDTTLIANPDGYPRGTRSASAIDMMDEHGAGNNLFASKIQFIFAHSAPADADGTTSVFELMGEADDGPRQLICTLALTAGVARVVVGSDLNTWVDTAVATDLRTTGVVIDNSATDGVVRVTVDVQGLRYWEALFTGAGSTATTATAYYRVYSDLE